MLAAPLLMISAGSSAGSLLLRLSGAKPELPLGAQSAQQPMPAAADRAAAYCAARASELTLNRQRHASALC